MFAAYTSAASLYAAEWTMRALLTGYVSVVGQAIGTYRDLRHGKLFRKLRPRRTGASFDHCPFISGR